MIEVYGGSLLPRVVFNKVLPNEPHNTKINSKFAPQHENEQHKMKINATFETQHDICSTTQNVGLQHDMKIKARHEIDSTSRKLQHDIKFTAVDLV